MGRFKGLPLCLGHDLVEQGFDLFATDRSFNNWFQVARATNQGRVGRRQMKVRASLVFQNFEQSVNFCHGIILTRTEGGTFKWLIYTIFLDCRTLNRDL